MITAERLRELMVYDPDTGIMKRRKALTGGHGKIGTVVGSLRVKDGYIQVKVDNRMYLMHRLAWLYVYGVWPEEFLDHINAVKSDNRIANLREATRSQNGANRPAQANNASGIKGIYRVKRHGKKLLWRAQIYQSGDGPKKLIFLGEFDCLGRAKAAYNTKARELYGEFARP